MYEQNVHIEEAPKEHLFGRSQQYRYRVLGKMVNLLFTTRTVLKMQNGISKCREH